MTSPTWRASEPAEALGVSRHHHERSQGFTLTELLLAIGLLSLMLGLNLPRIGAVRSTFFAAEEVRQVAGFIRAAHLEAVAGRTTVSIMIPAGEDHSLHMHQLESFPWPATGEPAPVAVHPDGMEITQAILVRTVEVSGTLRIEGQQMPILFFANGTSTGGQITLQTQDDRSCRQFLIDPGTGALFIQSGAVPW